VVLANQSNSDLLKHNQERIINQVEKALQNVGKATVLLAMDFDECAIDEHLSRQVTLFYEHRGHLTPEDKKNFDLKSIVKLFSVYQGLKLEEFSLKIKDIAQHIHWRKGFIKFFQELQTGSNIFPVFISSGLLDAAKIALKQIGIEKIAVIAAEITTDSQNIIQGAYSIISDQDKKLVIAELQKRHHFEKVVTVGHSAGDVLLIASGTPGFRLAFPDHQLAVKAADHVINDWREVGEYIERKIVRR